MGRAKGAGADEVVSAVLTASRVLVGISAASLAAVEERLTLTQFRTLVVLHADGQLGLQGLAKRTGVVSSTALRTVDRLIDLGLAERTHSTVDRREVILALTDEGRRVVDGATAHRRRQIAAVLRDMPPALRSSLVEAFEAFAAAAGEPSADGAPADVTSW